MSSIFGTVRWRSSTRWEQTSEEWVSQSVKRQLSCHATPVFQLAANIFSQTYIRAVVIVAVVVVVVVVVYPGSQVWMGCFLLIDWIVHIQELLNGTTVLELGAGTGLASIATDILIAVDRIYCTGETYCTFRVLNPYMCHAGMREDKRLTLASYC